jgi:hypothetical protein
MFLHKFEILNRKLKGLFQNLLAILTKLCAVTAKLVIWQYRTIVNLFVLWRDLTKVFSILN